jgi:rhodanese-related sulfurtransferase
MHINYTRAVLIISGVILGSVITLVFSSLRYTHLVYPIIDDIDPLVAYNQIVENKRIILIDVRSESEYALAHASSSLNLPIHFLYDDTHGIANEKSVPLPKNTDDEIYLLCTGGRLAGVAYSYLEHYGYRNIKRIKGGLKGWNESGLPIITQDLFDSKTRIQASPVLDRAYNP